MESGDDYRVIIVMTVRIQFHHFHYEDRSEDRSKDRFFLCFNEKEFLRVFSALWLGLLISSFS